MTTKCSVYLILDLEKRKHKWTLIKLEIFLVILTGGGGGVGQGCYWNLVGIGFWDAARYPTLHRAIPHCKELSSPKCQ